MAFVQLTVASIEQIDEGRLGKAFLMHLKRLIQDCNDRPKEKKKRKLVMEIDMVPVLGDDGVVETIGAEFEFTFRSKTPDHKSKTYSLRTNKQGQAAFSSESPENADQLTFGDINPATGKVDRGKAP